ncbi:Cytochrome c-type protein [Desulfosarcina cetonica]|uniref:NapC/NirT family cytochrome c n=1 Tax=Desulfosarcina cetonica TaxID=90730 RepID=UPI0006D21110|nr:NapC/NirT family cytochrome c [Desulfosarcina cetonica]VTR67400.1 Cytochrome c-type protein [Desulfosarcina cetonica]
MKKFWIALILIGVGVVIAFPLFSLTYYTMVRTSTPAFCASCHEIQPAVAAWRSSTHVNNPQGFVADCMDCHLPAPHKTFDFFFAKTMHGAKDVVMHFLINDYDRQQNREAAYASFDNAQCQKCHRNLLAMPHRRGAMLAHRTVLYARPGYARKCVDCHYDLVHNDSATIMYKQYRQVPYQAKGLKNL